MDLKKHNLNKINVFRANEYLNKVPTTNRAIITRRWKPPKHNIDTGVGTCAPSSGQSDNEYTLCAI